MNRYSLPIAEGTIEALSELRAGIARVGVTGRANSGDLVFGCSIEATTGRVVHICADQQDLEYKFEVFPICAKMLANFDGVQEIRELRLAEPVEVLLLETEDWLASDINCDGALGQGPIAQCQGRPGEEPESSVASCSYFGGIELRSANGEKLVIATLPFPYSIHISAIPCTGTFDQNAYVEVVASGA